jgi:hypothetical protein
MIPYADVNIVYSLYFISMPSDGSCPNLNYFYNNNFGFNIDDVIASSNLTTYAVSNGFTTLGSTIPQSELMSAFTLNATNPLLINIINSNIRIDSLSNNYVVSITNTITDYPNSKNYYLVTVWQNLSDITTLSYSSNVSGTPTGKVPTPIQYNIYTISLSNIVSGTNFKYSVSSNSITYTDVTTPASLLVGGPPVQYFFKSIGNISVPNTTYSNSLYYVNGSNYIKTPATITYNQTFSNISAYDPIITTYLFNYYYDVNLSGLVAYKKSFSDNYFYYIADITDTTPRYCKFKANLLNDGNQYPTIAQYFTNYLNFEVYNQDLTDDNGNQISCTNLSASSLSNYIKNNGYTSNYIVAEGFTNYKLNSINEKFTNNSSYDFISLESTNPFTINDFKLFTHKDTPIQFKLVKKESNILVFQIESRKVIGYSFTTNSTSSDYDPQSWMLKGYSGKKQTILDSRKLGKNLPRNYQLPLMYFNGTTKVLAQPQNSIETSIDKNLFIKYYKQKINPSMTINPKKYIKDNNSFYILYDEYDLNKNLVGKDLIIGFVMSGDKIKKAILYEDDDGNLLPFDLTKKHMKTYWDSRISLALLFQDF